MNEKNKDNSSQHITKSPSSASPTVKSVIEGRGISVGEHHDGNFNTYFGHKISKLLVQHNSSDSISNIFTGCAIFVNGYTQPPIQEIRRLVPLHGGTFNAYQTDRTTHFVCDNLSEAKLRQIRQTQSRSLLYVTALWLTNSIKNSKRLPECDYLPPGLKHLQGRDISQFLSKAGTSANATAGSIVNNGNAIVIDALHINRVSTRDSLSAPFGKFSLPLEDIESHNNTSSHHPDNTLISEQASLDSNQLGHPVSKGVASPAIDSYDLKQDSSPPQRHRPRLNTEEDPDFLRKYFHSSRLHFIGTWRTRLPQLVQKLRLEVKRNTSTSLSTTLGTGAIGPVGKAGDGGPDRVVVHVDMDCFFVSALVRETPSLMKVPLAVAHSSTGGSSEISSCNYPARSRGVQNGMFMARALSLCPELKVLSYNFPLYQRISEQVYSIFVQSAPIVQPVSVDEAFLEYPRGTDGLAMTAALRRRIEDETGCCASAGVGPNMLLARIATSKAKPNGQCRLSSADINEVLGPLPLARLPGVGYVMAQKLEQKGLKCCRDLWSFEKAEVQEWFGEGTGEFLWLACRGIDNRALQWPEQRKSIGAEVNWGLRFTRRDAAEGFVQQLGDEVSRRLNEAGLRGKTVTVKLKKRAFGEKEPAKFLGHGRCDNLSKSTTSNRGSYSTGESIGKVALALFRSLISGSPGDSIPVEDLRGMGIQVSRLESIEWGGNVVANDSVLKNNGDAGTMSSLDTHWLRKVKVDECSSPTLHAGCNQADEDMRLDFPRCERISTMCSVGGDGSVMQKEGKEGDLQTDFMDVNSEDDILAHLDDDETLVLGDDTCHNDEAMYGASPLRKRRIHEIISFEGGSHANSRATSISNSMQVNQTNKNLDSTFLLEESTEMVQPSSLLPSVMRSHATRNEVMKTDITLTQLDFLSALPDEIRLEQLQQLRRGCDQSHQNRPNEARPIRPSRVVTGPRASRGRRRGRHDGPRTQMQTRLPPALSGTSHKIIVPEICRDLPDDLPEGPGKGVPIAVDNWRWGRESPTSVRSALIEWRKAVGEEVSDSSAVEHRPQICIPISFILQYQPSLPHAQLLCEYCVWLLRNRQADVAASFVRACRSVLARPHSLSSLMCTLPASDCDHTGKETLTWQKVVTYVLEAFETHAVDIYGARILL